MGIKTAIGALILCLSLGACGASRQELAADDDATCQSYGAVPGSQPYIECRMRRDNTRQQGNDLRRAAAIAAP
jgi:hypothetical protein